MPNSDQTSCGIAFIDTVVAHTYCLPEADDVKAVFQRVYENMNEKNNFGKYIADIQNCW
jgi:hypothetical protein